MNETLPPIPPPAPPKEKSSGDGQSCLVKGCGCLLIFLAIMVVLGMVGAWYFNKKVLVEPFEPLKVTPDEELQIKAKLHSLQLLKGTQDTEVLTEIPASGLILTETEVNYWISQLDPEAERTLRVDFEPGELTAELRVGDEGGRRIRIQAKMMLEVVDGAIKSELADLRIANIPISREFLANLETEVDFEEVWNDPELQKELLQKVQRLEIQQDQILLIPHPETKNPE